ncbi:hypothetical protein ABK040_011241 [Willaertia magna]
MSESSSSSSSSTSQQQQIEQPTEHQQQLNKHHIHCNHCNLKLIKANIGTILQNETHSLPITSNQQQQLNNEYSEWIYLTDIFQFENIAFSNTIKNTDIKYLICAECEHDILGIAFMNNKKYLIAKHLITLKD